MTDQYFTPEELESEIWNPVPEWAELYLLSDFGRIQRLRFRCSRWANRITFGTMKNGYRAFTFCDGKRKEREYVHILVARVFIGPCPPGMEINHKDNIGTNNRLDNLEYVTHARNMQHAAEIGALQHGDAHWMRRTPELMKSGEMSHLTRFSTKTIEYVRSSSTHPVLIAAETGMSIGNVYHIRKGETRKRG